MRYLILQVLFLVLLFSCGEENASSAESNLDISKVEETKVTKTIIKSEDNYWNFIKKEVGLKTPQIRRIKAINKNYTSARKKLQKKNKWKGKQKRTLILKKESDLKSVLRKSFSKWKSANEKWLKK